MTSTPPTPEEGQNAHLSLLVLLPPTADGPAPIVPPSRPPPLTSRQSGSTVPSLKAFGMSSRLTRSKKDTYEEEAIDAVVSAGRRLSLAPGIGAGTQVRMLSPDRMSPVSTGPHDTNGHAETSRQGAAAYQASEAPTFGAKRISSMTGKRTRRPQTSSAQPGPAALLAAAGVSRGSIALPSGMGMGGSGAGRNRPGWEGDEVVAVLRGSGLQATVIRNPSHLPSVLSPSSGQSPAFANINQSPLIARPSTPAQLIPVILVPLCDSPSLPTLSLLLSQGTTPTAVCFQQDLLDRAKRTEEEWLNSAVDQIRAVAVMRDHSASGASTSEAPVIIAYSANPGITPAAVNAIVAAGAAGVLKPPYDLETASLLWRMVRAAREGRISSVVGLSTASDPLSPAHEVRSLDDDERHVVLPPTALSFGGEHEGEKVLSAALNNHKRSMSREWPSRPERSRNNSTHGPASRKQSVSAGTFAMTAELPEEESDNYHTFLESLYLIPPKLSARRRSIDVSGLNFALKRAQRVFEATAAAPKKPSRLQDGFTFPSSPSRGGPKSSDDEDEAADRMDGEDDGVTRLAELLSAMFYQTSRAIDIQMGEYTRLSTPMSPSQRAKLVDSLASWNFKPHQLEEGDLYRAACVMFEGILCTKGIADLDLDWEDVRRLLFAIRAIYHAPNPYHNYIHAIDVLQAIYSFLIVIGVVPPFSYLRTLTPETPVWTPPDEKKLASLGLGTYRARQVLRPQDVFALLIGAMGHDAGHPGLSNAFMKNAKTPLSQVYDDKSSLENMHCMLVVQLLRKHNFGFLLGPMSAKDKAYPARVAWDRKGFRKVLYSSVLSTDMSLHFAWIQRLKEFGESLDQPGDADEDRVMFCQALIKCADISNPTRPMDVSEHWSSVLLEEWAIQASLEQDLEIPVSVIASADAALQAKGQVGFIDLFTHPLFQSVSSILPELQPYADSCAANRALWSQRLESLVGEAKTSGSRIIQPVIDGASQETERFRTLFPLTLPCSMVGPEALAPGPRSPAVPRSFPSGPTLGSPNRPSTPSQRSSANCVGLYEQESPSAKAMRAVYHANLLDSRHKFGSWSQGLLIPGLSKGAVVDGRRMSAPNVILAGGAAV